MAHETDDKAFDDAFGEAIAAVEKAAAPAKEAEAAEEKAAEEKAATEAKAKQEAEMAAQVQETPEQKAAREAEEKKATDEAAVAEAKAKEEAEAKAKAETEAAARAQETPEQKTAREAEEKKASDEKAATEAKVAADKKAAEEKAVAEAKARQEAAAKTATEQKAADEQTRKEAEAKAKKELEELLKPYEYSEEEKKAMAAFQKEFPTEYAAMEARMRASEKANKAQAHQVMQSVLTYVHETFGPTLQGVAVDADERHFATLKDKISNYDEAVDLVPAWIDKQPAYLRTAMKKVYEEGTTQEVIDLFTRFNTETGRTETPEAKVKREADAAAAKAAAEAAERKKRATDEEIDSGLPVVSRRATPAPKGTPDVNDFDGAFKEAEAKL